MSNLSAPSCEHRNIITGLRGPVLWGGVSPTLHAGTAWPPSVGQVGMATVMPPLLKSPGPTRAAPGLQFSVLSLLSGVGAPLHEFFLVSH